MRSEYFPSVFDLPTLSTVKKEKKRNAIHRLALNDVHLDTNEAQLCLNIVEEYKERTENSVGVEAKGIVSLSSVSTCC